MDWEHVSFCPGEEMPWVSTNVARGGGQMKWVDCSQFESQPRIDPPRTIDRVYLDDPAPAPRRRRSRKQPDE
jgi:hypothetical protein